MRCRAPCAPPARDASFTGTHTALPCILSSLMEYPQNEWCSRRGTRRRAAWVSAPPGCARYLFLAEMAWRRLPLRARQVRLTHGSTSCLARRGTPPAHLTPVHRLLAGAQTSSNRAPFPAAVKGEEALGSGSSLSTAGGHALFLNERGGSTVDRSRDGWPCRRCERAGSCGLARHEADPRVIRTLRGLQNPPTEKMTSRVSAASNLATTP
jgi:hypothetical protein